VFFLERGVVADGQQLLYLPPRLARAAPGNRLLA
jgi:hypothetical protein